jgi:uncharacterized phage protein (TIGR02218 family)
MRTVPAALQAHLDQVDTTTTRLLKITLKSGLTYGLAMLDRNVSYDDGEYEGEIDYIATNGFDASTISADIGYSVDNAEGYALVSDGVPGVTTEMAEAGELDDATWVCYLVNYEDLSMGHVILDAGDLGEVRTKHGMIWIPELLSYAMRLRQPIGGVWSRTCRAIFGSPADSQTGCGVDLTPLWVSGEVQTVGAESDRVFVGDAVLDSTSGVIPEPGRVQWLTGVNAGREYAVEEVDGDEVTLSEPTLYAIEVGDTYRIRPDCKKHYIRDCIGVWANGINFKGEPYIPVGDAASIQVPGAQQPVGGGYVGNPVVPVEEPSAPDAPPAGDPSEWWPNWPMMNCTVLQGSSTTTILDESRHDELADKDLIVIQGFAASEARLQSRSEAIDAIHAINPNVKILLYTGVQQTLKVDTPDSNLNVQRDLIAHPTEGNPNWYVHRVGQPSSVVESYFNPLTLRMCNVARGAGLNSLGESYVQALWRKWDGLLDDPTWNMKSRLAGFFQDDYNARPPDMYASNGSVVVTDYDFNANGVADGRADFSSSANAGGRMWAEGHLDSKAAMENRFAGRLLIPNFGQTFVDYFDGGGVPPLPISDHPFYRQFEVGFTESANNQLGISKSSTAYTIESFGSVTNLMRALSILVNWLKSDDQNSITGKGCILLHANCVDRSTPTSADLVFARFIAALALLNERVATCVQQQPDRPLSLDETLLELGPPVLTRSMGTLNQSNVAFTLRTADFSSGVARFHWVVCEKGGVLARTDKPTPGAYPSADAAVSCTLPTPPSGKKNQRINAATYVHPITERAMRGQDTTLNSGADVTSISLRPYEGFFWRIVDV